MSNIKKVHLCLYNCAICQRRLDKLASSRFTLGEDEKDNEKRLKKYNDFKASYYSNNIGVISEGDLICKQCHSSIYHGTPPKSKRLIRSSLETDPQTSTFNSESASTSQMSTEDTTSVTMIVDNDYDNDQNQVDFDVEAGIDHSPQLNKIQLLIPRANCSHKVCVVCRISNDLTKLIVVPFEAILDCYIQKEIMIKSGCRCCASHLNDCKKFTSEALETIRPIGEYIEIDSANILALFKEFRQKIVRKYFLSKFESIVSFTDCECRETTGLSKDDFTQLSQSLVKMRERDERSKMQALAVYLFWLRTGLDQQTIGVHFEISQPEVSRYCEQIRAALLAEFVPNNLGVKHFKDRNDMIIHNTLIAKKLFIHQTPIPDVEPFIVVADGTYLYCQKSSNNLFQRKTYSQHKKTHLVKPFVVCATDGYIIDIFGFHEATKNDSTILLELLENDVQDIASLLKPNDIILLDRGFRDAKSILENKYSLKVKMPTCKDPKEPQLTTAEANETRFITKCRYKVEVVNGHLKSVFRALDKRVPNVSIGHYKDDFRIASALINKYYNSSFTSSDGEDAEFIADNMLANKDKENQLEKIIPELDLSKTSQFTKIDANEILDFPKLSLETIKTKITLGSYQIKQALGYIAEHFDEDGKYLMYLSKNSEALGDSKVILARLQSRHVNRIKYRVYIKYRPNARCCRSIESWLCSCKVGTRTVGCCSHIAAVVYYMSYGRYQENLENPAGHLMSIFPQYGKMCESESEDEEDNN